MLGRKAYITLEIDTYSGINTCPNEEDIKTLISWYRGESGEE